MKTIICTTLLFVSFFGCAQNESKIASPEYVGVSSEKLETLKDNLHQYVDDGKLAGIQTAILRKGNLVHYDSYGYADIERQKTLDKKSIFRIFSMTKPITSIGLMQLYEQGKFKLEDPIDLYIPELKHMTVLDENNNIVPAKNAITIIDLLRHSSGISYGRSHNQKLNSLYAQGNPGKASDLKDFIKKISKLPLLFEPGTAYEYGHSTDICGYLIQVLSGQSAENYLQEHILNPLKMEDTHFQLPKEKVRYFTTGYRAGENGNLEIAEIPEESMFINKPNFIKAGGGLVSTTNDYINFCKMLLNKGSLFGHQFLKPETIDLMTKDHLASVREHTPRLRILPSETGFGLGFSIAEQEDGSIIYGWGGAVGTYFRIDPEQDLAYIMMIQLSPYRQLNLRETFQRLVNNSIIDKHQNQDIIKPILLDKSMMSGAELKQVNLKDQPNREFYQSELYKGEEISVYMISSDTASKDFESFPIEEFVYLLNGSMALKPVNSNFYKFNVGDFIIANKGYKGSWRTIGGPKYHLELSVISNKRADKNKMSKIKHPFTINKDLISGTNIKLNESRVSKNVVFSGVELEISVQAEKPRNIIIQNNLKERFIHVLGGWVSITPKKGEMQTFYSGDFFILPKGFKGTWNSFGQDLFRSINVKALE